MPTYSHSRISSFENCPLKYKLAYIEKPDIEAFTSIEAFLGSRVHDALEKLYKDLMYSKLLTLDQLLAFFDGIWKKNWSDDVRVIRDDYEPENYWLMGQRFIKDYYEKYAPFDQDRTLGLEERVVVDLGGKYKLQGYIDRLALRDGVYEIHDYKTSSSLPPQEKLDADRQLALYALAIKRRLRDVNEVELVWHYLAFNREMRSSRTDESLEELEKHTIGLIKEIEAATKRDDFPARESGLCRWCEFQSLCPKFRHLNKVRQLPLNEYVKEPGVVLVNKFVSLKNKINELDEEMDKVKAAMFELAEREGLETIAGADHKVRVKIAKIGSFPGKNDPKRRELEGAVKEGGIWDDVSALDTRRLSKLVAEGALPDELAEKISKFKTLQESKKLYLSRL